MLIFIPLKRQLFSSRSFVVRVCGETKQWSRWSLNRRSPTMRHVSKTHRVALDWFVRSNQCGPMIQIKYTDTRNQLAEMLTQGNFTRDEWNHLLCLFIISHFSSAECSEVMSRRKHKKNQVRKESQRSQDPWWIWLREAAKGLHQLYHFHHQEASGKPDKKVKVLWVRKLKCTIERRNPMFAVTSVTRKVQEKRPAPMRSKHDL